MDNIKEDNQLFTELSDEDSASISGGWCHRRYYGGYYGGYRSVGYYGGGYGYGYGYYRPVAYYGGYYRRPCYGYYRSSYYW